MTEETEPPTDADNNAETSTTTTAVGEVEGPPMDHRQMSWSSIQGFSNPLAVARVLVNNFSTVDGQRAPPSPAKTVHLHLATIGVSPFCEKVRWALDLLEGDETSDVYYTEDAHPAAFHAFRTVPVTNGESSRTPLLIYPNDGNGNYKNQSHVILPELLPSLYPEEIADEIKKFELDMGERVGATMRCIAYYYLLDKDKKYYSTLVKIGTRNTSAIESLLFEKMLDKGVDKALKKGLVVNEQTRGKSVQEINKCLEEVSQRLEQNGGEYIFDTPDQKYGFTAADLTWAALTSPMLRPPEMIDFTGLEEDFPNEFVELARQFQQTKAGQHCWNMYKKHRPLQDDGLVHIKTANRDTNPMRRAWNYMAGK